MTSVRGRGRPRRERISEALSGSSPPPGSDHDELSGNPTPGPVVGPIVDPIAGPVGPPVAKYTEEDLQRILKTVLEARAPAPRPDGP